MTAAFLLYASGEYSLSELAAVLEARGFRTRPATGVPRDVGINRLQTLLRNDYYIGTVRYAGKVYEGSHERLTTPAIFERVQTVLDAQRTSGERTWRHRHYLSGSLYCSDCGGRLIYTQARGRSSVYEYFVCSGRQKVGCQQPHHRVEAVEEAVAAHYAKVTLTEEERERVREAIRDFAAFQAAESLRSVSQAEKLLRTLERQEEKLLAAHYADQSSDALFASETQRIRRERSTAEKVVSTFEMEANEVLEAADVAIDLCTEPAVAYGRAPASSRQQFNKAFFAKIFIDEELISEVELNPPFQELIALARAQPGRPALHESTSDGQLLSTALDNASGAGESKTGAPRRDAGSNFAV